MASQSHKIVMECQLIRKCINIAKHFSITSEVWKHCTQRHYTQEEQKEQIYVEGKKYSQDTIQRK